MNFLKGNKPYYKIKCQIVIYIKYVRFYKFSESKERVPKIANYYKNYLTFFCNPIFRNFKINDMIQAYSDNKAEFYYNKTYTNKKQKDKKKEESFMFNTIIKKDIDEVMLTELPENNNSIFNDEFFIYRPEKKRFDLEGNPENSSHLILDYSRTDTMKSGLLVLQTKEDDIFQLVSNLSNQPLNDKIFDKIQQKNTKKIVKSTYNFSTTDKSKGDSQNINNINKENTGSIVHNGSIPSTGVYVNKQESYQMQDLMNKNEHDHHNNKINNNTNNTNNNSNSHHTNNNSKITYNINMRNPSPITPVTPLQDHVKPYFGFKNVHEIIDAAKNLVPSSSKNKLIINNQDQEILSKLLPTSVKQQKFNIASTSIKNANNKLIEHKQIKLKPSNSNSKFSNLLYSSESNLKNIGNLGNKDRTSSNPKIPTKQIRNIDIMKYSEDLKSPANVNPQFMNNLQEFRNIYEAKPRYEVEEHSNHNHNQNPIQNINQNNGHKPTLSVHLDKILKTRQPSYENFMASSTRQAKHKTSNNNGTASGSEKISYNTKDDDYDEANSNNKIKKVTSERQFHNIGYNNLNNNLNSNLKLVNYITSTKNINNNNNINQPEDRVPSSFNNTKTTLYKNGQLKIKYNLEKTPSNANAHTNINYNEGKIKLQSKYFHIEQKTLASTRGYNKSKDIITNVVKINQIPNNTNNPSIQTPVNHNRIKSVDVYSNNYINSNNVNSNFNNPNLNAFLSKIASTKNLNPETKTKKISFSPQSSGKR